MSLLYDAGIGYDSQDYSYDGDLLTFRRAPNYEALIPGPRRPFSAPGPLDDGRRPLSAGLPYGKAFLR